MRNASRVYVHAHTVHLVPHDDADGRKWVGIRLVQALVYGADLSWCRDCWPKGKPR